MSGTTITVADQAELNSAIETIDQASQPGNYNITFAGNITEGAAGQPAGIDAIDAAPGVDVTINGNGFALDGAGTNGGLAVIGGKVTISSLTIEDTLAKGGDGSGSGGGGAGLGGGLFVGPTADVALQNVSFQTDAAKGGAGGTGGGGGAGGDSSLIVPNLGGDGAKGATGAQGAPPGGVGGPGATGGQGGFGGAGGDGAGGVGGHGGQGGFGGGGGDGGDGGGGGDSDIYGTRGATGYSGTIHGQIPVGNGAIGGQGGAGGTGKEGGAGGFGAAGGGGGKGGEGGAGGTGGVGGNFYLTGGSSVVGLPALPGGDGGDGGNGGAGGDGGTGGAGGFGGGGGGGGGPGAAGGDSGQGGAAGTGYVTYGVTRIATNTTAKPGEEGADGAQGAGGGFGGAGFGGGRGALGSQGAAGGGGLGAGGDIFVAQGGTLTVDGGLLSEGSATGGQGVQNGSAYGSGIFLQGNEAIALGADSGQTLTVAGVIADQSGSGGTGSNAGAGRLVINGDGTVKLDAQNTFVGGITIDSGTLDLAHMGAAGAGPIVFAGDPVLAFSAASAPANPIESFFQGDSLVIAGFSATNHGYTGSTLTLDGPGGPIALDIPGAIVGDFQFVVADNATTIISDQPACYREGTLIETDRGEIPIENLAIGDRVLTRGRKYKPIKWVGRRAYSGAFALANPNLAPVRIQAGALASTTPRRDLYVSPEHALFLAGVLVPARHLVNGTSITGSVSV